MRQTEVATTETIDTEQATITQKEELELAWSNLGAATNSIRDAKAKLCNDDWDNLLEFINSIWRLIDQSEIEIEKAWSVVSKYAL